MANILINNFSKYTSTSSWASIPNSQALGGSVARSNGTEELTSFTVAFNGTSISFFIVGSLFASPNLPASSTITVDGMQTFEVPIESGDFQNSSLLVEKHWFTTPVLTDATHTVSAINFPRKFSLDYAIVTPGAQTPLANELMVIDDDSDLLTYSSAWHRNTSTYLIPFPHSQDQLSFVPLNGVTHHVSTITSVVDTWAEFNFTGTSVSIYGILDGSTTGTEKLTVAYTLDGFKTQQDYYPASQTQANFLWFSNTTVPLGLHTVQIDILRLNGVDFILDYIVYDPSSHPQDHTTPFAKPFVLEGGNGDDSTLPSKSTKKVVLGSLIGGIVGLALIIGLIRIWRYFQLRRSREELLDKQLRDLEELLQQIIQSSTASSPGTNTSRDELVVPSTLGVHSVAPLVASPPENDGEERRRIHVRLQELQNLVEDIRREIAGARNGGAPQAPSSSSPGMVAPPPYG
ncbi:hypothetical protein H0H87_009877 [Tephrocybe sp. NHM501043]|nr:hypothetical protein H0H87_009877 [Tephrocybe sp. NHM501043]